MKLLSLISISATLAAAQAPAARQTTAISSEQGRPAASFDCAADGTVVNSITGEPIPRARINIVSGGVAYASSSDTAGRWTLSNVGCAPAQLIVTRPGFIRNIGSKGSPSQPLTLLSGSPVHDVRTELAPQSVALGRVLDDRGDPYPVAQITVLGARVVNGKLRFQPSGTGMTNDLGEYRIANLSRGRYIVCAHINPGGPTASNQTIPADSCYPGPPEGGAASAMAIPAGREVKVDFTLHEVMPVHIRGTVSGIPEGRGIGVSLIRRGGEDAGASNFPGQIRDGKFDFRVPPGSYMLTADYFEAGRRLTARVPVDAGSFDVENVAVRLDTGFTVTGIVRVASDSGRAFSRFPVSLRSAEPASGTGQVKWAADQASFAINDMVPGNFRLNAFPPAPFYLKSATLAGQDIACNDIPISQAAGPIEVTLRDDGGSIEGDIVDAAGQPAVAGIVLLRGNTSVSNAIAGSDGHFKLQYIAPGDYTIYAWDDIAGVQYAEPDWMRRYGTGGSSVTVSSGRIAQIRLIRQIVPD
ncbi:MAG: carboxypeptidase regulatory-like domain-containing protein [Acidobacteriota bacterium]|nr:carboxypeptidase regulatory-like domain-containing protein [Acidobacteriota bacterium]